MTQGGTLAALARHLYTNDAFAVGATVLTGQQRSATLAITEATLNQVNAHFKDLENDFHATTSRRFSDLTESEGNYISRTNIVQRFRDEIAARRVTKEHGVDNRSIPQTGLRSQSNSDVKVKPLTPYEISKKSISDAMKPHAATRVTTKNRKNGLGL